MLDGLEYSSDIRLYCHAGSDCEGHLIAMDHACIILGTGFAVRTILNWYRAGVDVERQIPELATDLGHTHVTDTYWYVSAVPKLMQLAAMRLE